MQPEGLATSAHSDAKSTKLGVVSVRSKVIEELKKVMDTSALEPAAETALEYCIKMISSNQLNEQDFDFASKD